MNRVIFPLFLMLCSIAASAQQRFVDRSSDVLCLVPSSIALADAVYQGMENGSILKRNDALVELGLSSLSCIVSNYIIESKVDKMTPDGSGMHSFPSTHTAAAFNGSTYIAKKYGIKYAIPSYVMSLYVAWGRVYADKHDIWDVMGGIALGTGTALVFTRPTKNNKFIIKVSLL